MKKEGYIGILDGVKNPRPEKKSPTLLRDKEKPDLYSQENVAKCMTECEKRILVR